MVYSFKEQLQQLINTHYKSRTDFVRAILPYTEPNFEGAPSQSNTAKKLSKQLNGSIGVNNAAFYRLWFQLVRKVDAADVWAGDYAIENNVLHEHSDEIENYDDTKAAFEAGVKYALNEIYNKPTHK